MRASEKLVSVIIVSSALTCIVLFMEDIIIQPIDSYFRLSYQRLIIFTFFLYSLLGIIIIAISLYLSYMLEIRFEEEGFRPIILGSSIAIGTLLIILGSFIFGFEYERESIGFLVTTIVPMVLLYLRIRGRLYQHGLETISCPKCQSDIFPSFIVCPYCSHHVAGICPSCKRQVQANFAWCPFCTSKLVPLALK